MVPGLLSKLLSFSHFSFQLISTQSVKWTHSVRIHYMFSITYYLLMVIF